MAQELFLRSLAVALALAGAAAPSPVAGQVEGGGGALRDNHASHYADSSDMAELRARLLDETEPFVKGLNASSLARFRNLQARVASVTRTVQDARTLVTERRQAVMRAQASLDEFAADLRIVRTPSARPRDVLAACNRLYTSDPRVFPVNAASCRENYSISRDWYGQTLREARRDTSGIGLLVQAVDTATARVRKAEAAIQEAEYGFENEIEGQRAYKTVLLVVGGVSLAILLLVTMTFDVKKQSFSLQQVLELVTVLAVVMAVIYFGSIEALNGESVAGLLAGIVGYVLGQRGRRETEMPAGRNGPGVGPAAAAAPAGGGD